MLGIENQRDVHDPGVQFRGRLITQQVQEVAPHGLVIGLGVDAHAIVRIAIPVADDRGQHGEQAIGGVLLLLETLLGLQVAEHGRAGAHHVHGMGTGRNLLEHCLERGGQPLRP